MIRLCLLQHSNNVKALCIFLFLLTLAHNQFTTNQYFCHSSCIGYVGACFGTSQNSCYVCANSIYKDKDFTNPNNPCVLSDQRKIMFKDLDSSTALSLTGFQTSNPNTFTCAGLPFSGKYVNTDYLEKNFTGIATEHFELVIRFNLGYFGAWGSSDNLQLEVNDGVSTTYHSWGYNCGQQYPSGSIYSQTKNLCSTQGKDCIKIKQFTIQHNSSYVYLKWTSLTSESDPNIQSWGIKDVLITAKTCHRYCDKCFGQQVNQCLTCSPGFFLRGNTCILKCPRLSVPSTQQCVDSCPSRFYHNALNDFCEPCLDGCTLCAGQSHCLLWDNQKINTTDGLFYDKMELWIIMILGGVAIAGLIIWKLIIKRYCLNDDQVSSGLQDSKESNPKNSKSSNSGQLNSIQKTQENLTNQLWMVDAQNLDPVKVDVRRRKKRKADLDQSANNSQLHL